MKYPEVSAYIHNYLTDKISVRNHMHTWIITDIPNTISSDQFRHLCDIGEISNVFLLRNDYTQRMLASAWYGSKVETLEQFTASYTLTWNQFVHHYRNLINGDFDE